MVAAHPYTLGGAMQDALKKLVNLNNVDTLKVTLHTSAYTPNQDTHQFQSDLTNEVSGTGYTAGGATLTSVTLTQSGHVMTLAAANTSWTSSTITARYAVVADTSPGTAGTNPLLCYVDFVTDVVSTGGTFLITWNASGIITWTGV